MQESVIASSECTTLIKHAVPGKGVFQVTVTFNHADMLKLIGALVHTLLLTNTVARWLILTVTH